jgi:hypothetical protein
MATPPGRQPDRRVALHRRETAELLAEELRRLDRTIYGESLARLAASPPSPASRVAGKGRGER